MAKKQAGASGEAERRFKQDLKAGTLANFYIVSGEEAFLRDHYLRLLTQKLTGGPAGEFNFHRFTAADCTPQALSDAIDAMPMMAERTLVRVDDVDPPARNTRPSSAIFRITAASYSPTTPWNSRSTPR